jgi:hypothetical protein
VLILLWAADDAHQSVDVIITSEEFCANQNLAVVQPAMYTSKVQ